jgi:hypothetical protein
VLGDCSWWNTCGESAYLAEGCHTSYAVTACVHVWVHTGYGAGHQTARVRYASAIGDSRYNLVPVPRCTSVAQKVTSTTQPCCICWCWPCCCDRIVPRLDEAQLMSRCSVCNAAAFRRITHEQAAAHPEVTERLRSLVTEFWECGK